MLTMMRTTTLLLVTLLAAAAPVGARAQQTSPKASMTATICHDEATKRYIEDFRRLGTRQKTSDDVPAVTTTFVNDNPKYEDYYAECRGRWNATKAR